MISFHLAALCLANHAINNSTNGISPHQNKAGVHSGGFMGQALSMEPSRSFRRQSGGPGRSWTGRVWTSPLLLLVSPGFLSHFNTLTAKSETMCNYTEEKSVRGWLKLLKMC